MKRFLERRTLGLRVSDFKMFSRLLKYKMRSLEKTMERTNGRITYEQLDTFLEQARISKEKILERVYKWDLEVQTDILDELASLEIHSLQEVGILIECIDVLHWELLNRYKLTKFSYRLLFLPITKGELFLLFFTGVFVYLMF